MSNYKTLNHFTKYTPSNAYQFHIAQYDLFTPTDPFFAYGNQGSSL